jgi:hypothetical protein
MYKEAIEGINRIEKTPVDKFNAYKSIIKDLKRLEHRETCPLCRSHVNSQEVQEELKIFEDLKLKIWNEVQEFIQVKKERSKERELKEKKERDDLIKAAIEYFRKNKKEITSKIRNYFKKPEIKLPNLTTLEDKVVWNKAIELYCDDINKDYLEYEELLFKV